MALPDDRPVLVGFDGSAAAQAALRFAVRHCATTRAPLAVVGVAQDLADVDRMECALAVAARWLREAGPAGARTRLLVGPVAPTLAEATLGARLLVVGRSLGPNGGRELRLGVDVPVVEVPAAGWEDETGVLVTLTGGGGDGSVLAGGRDWAVHRGVRLHVVHALRRSTP